MSTFLALANLSPAGISETGLSLYSKVFQSKSEDAGVPFLKEQLNLLWQVITIQISDWIRSAADGARGKNWNVRGRWKLCSSSSTDLSA